MTQINLGQNIHQVAGYKAFIPEHFPAFDQKSFITDNIIAKHSEAARLIGKLDGTTLLLPDKDWFLRMFILKDASNSSQIEGTRATMTDAIQAENIDRHPNLPADVDDILHYIKALNYGLDRAQKFPLGLRLIKELHSQLMSDDARATQFAYPGEFRTGQNWIGGTRPDNAEFVPPPPHEMMQALGDLEAFIHVDDDFLPLVKAALIHGQFETIHPFNDGNGRTGRMLITMYIWYRQLLELPVLYLSAFFKKHQHYYYQQLNGYHHGIIDQWVDFFLDAVIETADLSIKACRQIVAINQRDQAKIQQLNQKASVSTMKMLLKLYQMPIVGIADVVQTTGLSERGAYDLINRMIQMEILTPDDQDRKYGQKWVYRDYLDVFLD